MTGFSEPFRSQAFAAGLQQASGESRNQSLARSGENIASGIRHAQELQLRQQEVNLRIQEFEMNRQIQQRKLQEMMAVDMAERSRLENEALKTQIAAQKAQTDALTYDVDRRRRMESSMDPTTSRLAHMYQTLRGALPPIGSAAAASLGIGMADGSMKMFPPGSKEFDENLERAKEAERAGLLSDAPRRAGAVNNAIIEKLRGIRREMATILPSGGDVASLPPDQQRRYKELAAEEKRYAKVLDEVVRELGYEVPAGEEPDEETLLLRAYQEFLKGFEK